MGESGFKYVDLSFETTSRQFRMEGEIAVKEQVFSYGPVVGNGRIENAGFNSPNPVYIDQGTIL
jgi:hypothetical protein